MGHLVMLDLDDMLVDGRRQTVPRVPSPGDYGSASEAAKLRKQLALLRSWADPANTSSQAVTYRAMEAAADEAIRAAGGREATTGSGTLHAPRERTHGTISCYNAGCHCDACRAVAAAKGREKRRRAAERRQAVAS